MTDWIKSAISTPNRMPMENSEINFDIVRSPWYPTCSIFFPLFPLEREKETMDWSRGSWGTLRVKTSDMLQGSRINVVLQSVALPIICFQGPITFLYLSVTCETYGYCHSSCETYGHCHSSSYFTTSSDATAPFPSLLYPIVNHWWVGGS